MDHMPPTINQDIFVMSVLQLKQILEQRVACQTTHEIRDSSLPTIPEYLLVYGAKGLLVRGLLKSTNSFSSLYKLDQATLFVERDNPVGPNP
jgi:hypothetical protein